MQTDFAVHFFFRRRASAGGFKPPSWLRGELLGAPTTPACELCDMVFTTDTDLLSHVAGKKHARALAARARAVGAKQRRKRGRTCVGGVEGGEGGRRGGREAKKARREVERKKSEAVRAARKVKEREEKKKKRSDKGKKKEEGKGKLG